MPLNHKRRIFRPGAHVPFRSLQVPLRGMFLFGLGATVALGFGAWLLTRSSEAPAQPPTTSRLVAESRDVAVVDGGTLRIKDRVVRLGGIDVPGRTDLCKRADGQPVECGAQAASALATLVRDTKLDCLLNGHDDFGRPLAECSSSRLEINRAMVELGWARPTKANPGLVPIEAEARANQRGMWGLH